MRINIYQIDGEKDTNRVKFSGYDETMKHGGIISQNYKCVFHGDVDGDLEDVYTLFNDCDHPGTFQGHSLSVSDIIEATGSNPEVILLTVSVLRSYRISIPHSVPRWTVCGC